MCILPNKVLLIILDGWGIATKPEYSAICNASTPYLDYLYRNYPNSKLSASGVDVGLPTGQVGNSEVGHFCIGTGRAPKQWLTRINDSLINGQFYRNRIITEAFKYAKEMNNNVHLIGLVSNGGLHSHINHLKAISKLAKSMEVNNLYIHAFTDGRDTPPNSSKQFLNELELCLKQNTGRLATIIGRYYAMDRDNRWQRIAVAYNAMVNSIGIQTNNWHNAIDDSYKKGITDEFLDPIICMDESGFPLPRIKGNDVVLCFNFRTDRCRQITETLTQREFGEFSMKPLNLHYITMTEYDSTFKNVKSIFQKEVIKDTLGDILSQYGKTQLRIAETEKYAHVTYFFSGGREAVFPCEKRILCPSPQVNTYDLQPEMAAYDITKKTLKVLNTQKIDFICLNFANADMVGHTGNFAAAIKACEAVDNCVEKITKKALQFNYSILIISDHGNADIMLDDSGNIHTSHTTNLVPCIWVDNQNCHSLKDGTLADVGPSILKYMKIPQPLSMTGVGIIY